MSFYLAETSTLEAVATEDERALAQDLQARVLEAVQQAESQAPVAEAARSHHLAQGRLERLQAAERALNQSAKESHERVGEISERVLETLVEAAATGKDLDFQKLDELAAGEAQIRALAKAVERLTEHLIPRAQIASPREEAHAPQRQGRRPGVES